MEWILGNTFSMIVFGTYGAFWLTLGATLTPFYNAEGFFTTGKTGDALLAAEAEYYSSYGMCSVFVDEFFKALRPLIPRLAS
jgi:succinate-acetate transporter protein